VLIPALTCGTSRAAERSIRFPTPQMGKVLSLSSGRGTPPPVGVPFRFSKRAWERKWNARTVGCSAREAVVSGSGLRRFGLRLGTSVGSVRNGCPGAGLPSLLWVRLCLAGGRGGPQSTPLRLAGVLGLPLRPCLRLAGILGLLLRPRLRLGALLGALRRVGRRPLLRRLRGLRRRAIPDLLVGEEAHRGSGSVEEPH